MTFNAGTNEIPIGFFESIPVNDERRFYKHVNILSENQKSIVTLLNEWFQMPVNDIIIISGSPGSGKSFSVIETLDYTCCCQLRMAYTNKVAYNIRGSTIHSTFTLNWDETSILHKIITDIEKLDEEKPDYIETCIDISNAIRDEMVCHTNPDIVVIDEIGMVPFWLTIQIINYFFSILPKRKLFILIGDEYQLKPVKCKYNIFDTNVLNYRIIYLDDNKRFTSEYKIIIDKMKMFIKQNNPDDFKMFITTTFPVLEDIYDYDLKKCDRVLTYKNETVDKYNQFYIDNLPGSLIVLPIITTEQTTSSVTNKYISHDTSDKWISLKTNCDIIVTKKNAVPNGTFLKFLKYDNVRDILICKMLNSDKANVFITRDKYTGQFPILIRYASTIHRYQGETINDKQILISFDRNEDMHLMYTAFSRVRSLKQIFAVIL